jgi:hypothetical protein
MNTPLIITLVLIAALVVIYFFIAKPVRSSNKSEGKNLGKFKTIEDKYNAERREREIELDNLLDKIAKKGIESLSSKERDRLEQLSGKK